MNNDFLDKYGQVALLVGASLIIVFFGMVSMIGWEKTIGAFSVFFILLAV